MLRWAGRARVVLILLALLAAIVVPIVVSGYVDLSRATDAYNHGDHANAAMEYRAAALKLPWKNQLWEQVALSEMQYGNREAAITIYQARRQAGTLSPTGWEILGAYACSTGNCQEGVKTWLAGLGVYPSNTRFYYLLASGYGQIGDYDSEESWLAKWMNTGKAAAQDHYYLGKLLLATEPARARQELAQASSADTNLNAAVQTLDASLALADLESSPSRRLVIIARGLGLVNDWPLAQYDFQQAVNSDPQNAEAWAWLGEAQQQNKQDGKLALDKALELDPNSPVVHGLRGLYWKRQGKPKAAVAEYQAAARLEPKNPEWQAALGDAYASTGDLVQALAAYVTATDLAPDSATYWRLLALFSADNGVQVLDVGLPAAKKAAAIAPDDPQVLDALGWTYAQTGLLTTAEQTLNKAIKIAPNSASAHLHLAETYLRQGQGSFAQSELSRVVELDPAGPAGTFAAQLLKQYFP